MKVAVGIVGAGPAGLLTAHILDFSAQNHRCEFRTPYESVVLDYGTLTGGRPHYIYPQHHLVDRLYEALAQSGADIRCAHTVDAVSQRPDGVTLSVARGDGARFDVHCQVVVGCEGSRSIVAGAMRGISVSEQQLPVRWLAVIGAAPPLESHTIYAAHPGGFAGHMRRDPGHTRYYLEIPASDTATDWPEHRIREELSARLACGGRLDGVAFSDASFVDLRMRMAEPMQQGRLYLAGDAAHLITPAGGKGMNLALQDAVELAHGLVDRFGSRQDGERLSAYSATRLPVIWRTQAFSNWFLHLLLAGLQNDREPGPEVSQGFARGLRAGWLTALQTDPLLARWFAHAYAGADSE